MGGRGRDARAGAGVINPEPRLKAGVTTFQSSQGRAGAKDKFCLWHRHNTIYPWRLTLCDDRPQAISGSSGITVLFRTRNGSTGRPSADAAQPTKEHL